MKKIKSQCPGCYGTGLTHTKDAIINEPCKVCKGKGYILI